MNGNGFRRLPIGVQGFMSLRGDGFLYVDKTEYIYRLSRGSRQYFLSRPRRFGKSLLLSTLRAYWEGRKELFKGLAIERLEEENAEAWQPYPVFYFDLNKDSYQKNGILEEVLADHLKEWEQVYGCEDSEALLSARFRNLIRRAFDQTGRRVVILVDEYDKPLFEGMRDPALEEHNKAVFKGFFSTLKKSAGGHIVRRGVRRDLRPHGGGDQERPCPGGNASCGKAGDNKGRVPETP